MFERVLALLAVVTLVLGAAMVLKDDAPTAPAAPVDPGPTPPEEDAPLLPLDAVLPEGDDDDPPPAPPGKGKDTNKGGGLLRLPLVQSK